MTEPKHSLIDANWARSHMSYNRETGKLVWKERDPINGFNRAFNRSWAGAEIGGLSKLGYLEVQIARRCYQVHRLAWLIETGEWPPAQIDHINGIKNDNRWTNLRPVTKAQNGVNLPISKRNTSGFKGVSFRKPRKSTHTGKWVAEIQGFGQKIWIGAFNTAEEASAAYQKKAEELHGEYRRMNEKLMQLEGA